jgi:dienelactone hydrolase
MHAMNEVFKPLPSWWSLLDPRMYFNKIWGISTFAPTFIPFLVTSSAPKAYADCLRYTRAVKADLPAGGKLGAAGFCWGGYPSTKLCGESASAEGEGAAKPLLDAAFSAHPSSLDAPKDIVDSLGKYKTPYFCAVAEFDFLFNKGVAEQTEVALRKELGPSGQDKAGPYEFFIHEGAHHGFSVRASPDAPGEVGKVSYETAAAQAVDWFNKYLK